MSETTEAVRDARPVNRLALASCVCAIVSPLIFATFVTVGTLQEMGHSIFLESHRYESIARLLMLVLSGLAVLLAYRAEFQIAISNGLYRGHRLASAGRIVGFGWGAVILIALLLWPL
jgi:hypothetical protein